MHRCKTIGNNENYVNYIKHSINKSRNQWNFARVLIQIVRDLRPCEMWRSSRFSRGPLDFLCSIRKENTLQRITGKFCGRRDGSLRCSRSDQRSLLPLIRRHSSSSPTMNPKADNRSIDFRPRSIRRDVYVRGELRQSSSTAHHNFRLARSIPPKTTSSSRITLFSCRFFLHFFFLLFLVSPSTSLFVVVLALFYFSSYSRVQFCVLLPPVTLAENNNNICSPPLDKGRQ